MFQKDNDITFSKKLRLEDLRGKNITCAMKAGPLADVRIRQDSKYLCII